MSFIEHCFFDQFVHRRRAIVLGMASALGLLTMADRGGSADRRGAAGSARFGPFASGQRRDPHRRDRRPQPCRDQSLALAAQRPRRGDRPAARGRRALDRPRRRFLGRLGPASRMTRWPARSIAPAAASSCRRSARRPAAAAAARSRRCRPRRSRARPSSPRSTSCRIPTAMSARCRSASRPSIRRGRRWRAWSPSRPAQVGRSFEIDYAIEPASIPRHSLVDLIEGRVPPSALAGKRIIIGATAVELGDRYAVPRHGVIPGVVIQALAAETLLAGPMPEDGARPGRCCSPCSPSAAPSAQARARAALMLFAAGVAAVLALPLCDRNRRSRRRCRSRRPWPRLLSAALLGAAAFGAERYRAARRQRRGDRPSQSARARMPAAAARMRSTSSSPGSTASRRSPPASGPPPTASSCSASPTGCGSPMPSAPSIRTDDSSLAWIEGPEDEPSLEDRIDAISAVMRQPIDCGRPVDVLLTFGLATGWGERSRASSSPTPRWRRSRRPRRVPAGAASPKRTARRPTGGCRCSASSTTACRAASSGTPTSPSSTSRPAPSSAPRRWCAGTIRSADRSSPTASSRSSRRMAAPATSPPTSSARRSRMRCTGRDLGLPDRSRGQRLGDPARRP